MQRRRIIENKIIYLFDLEENTEENDIAKEEQKFSFLFSGQSESFTPKYQRPFSH